jgi:hypothetical protein
MLARHSFEARFSTLAEELVARLMRTGDSTDVGAKLMLSHHKPSREFPWRNRKNCKVSV